MKKLLAGATIFWGALLVFGIQPMVGSTLLPVFGGTAAVWTVCLAAFQTLLLAGYFYAHLYAGGLSVNKGRKSVVARVVVHVGLLVLAACWVFVVAAKFHSLSDWAGAFPVPAVGALGVVVLLVGLPYLLLSANSSFVQALAVRFNPGRKVYRLYAVSNAGSLIGLLAYPFLIEPHVTLRGQWIGFGCGILIYAVLLLLLTLVLPADARGGNAAGQASGHEEADDVRWDLNVSWASTPGFWMGMSALSCFLLNTVTTYLTAVVTPLPLLWAVLLALYLISYIIAFSETGALLSRYCSIPLLGLVVWALYVLGVGGNVMYKFQLIIGFGFILVGGWMIHGLLYASRPKAGRLTLYYLMLALGGAVGGIAASVVMPLVSSSIIEYPCLLGVLGGIAAFVLLGVVNEKLKKFEGVLPQIPGKIVLRASGVVVVIIAIYGITRANVSDGVIIHKARNFYGCGRVVDEIAKVKNGQPYETLAYYDNGTLHGFQVVDGKWRSRSPTSYFGENGGGAGIISHPYYEADKGMRVAIAGMGIGTLASYARGIDTYRFYEINPQVVELASNSNLFTFVSGCPGKIEIVTDDARKALERERAANEPKWDVLVIDVFSGDSIPSHLATKEAFQLYLDRLAPDGILAFHITNWHLELSRMVKAMASEFQLNLQGIFGLGSAKCCISYWAYMTRQPMEIKPKGNFHRVDYGKVKDVPLMTDEKHSLLPYLTPNAMQDLW